MLHHKSVLLHSVWRKPITHVTHRYVIIWTNKSFGVRGKKEQEGVKLVSAFTIIFSPFFSQLMEYLTFYFIYILHYFFLYIYFIYFDLQTNRRVQYYNVAPCLYQSNIRDTFRNLPSGEEFLTTEEWIRRCRHILSRHRVSPRRSRCHYDVSGAKITVAWSIHCCRRGRSPKKSTQQEQTSSSIRRRFWSCSSKW